MINKRLLILTILMVVFCALSNEANAMGSAPPAPTEEVGAVPTASEEVLAREQVENLKNISINSKTIDEAYGKAVRDIGSKKKYLYEYNKIAQRQLILDLLDDNQDWKYRFAIIEVLNPDRPPEALDAFIKVFKNKRDKIEIRRLAVQSIADTKLLSRKYLAVDALIGALKDDDWDLVLSAANGLGQESLRDKKAVYPLIESVKRTKKHLDDLLTSGWKGYEHHSTPEDLALSCSIRALGDIGDNKAIPVLIEVISDPNLSPFMLEDVTKGWAIIALKKINDPEVIPSIKDALKDLKDADVRTQANEAIKQIGNKDEKDTFK